MELKKINIEANKVIVSKSFTEKLFGLMFRKKFPKNKYGMLIKNANWIHTLFMKVNIDVLYLDKNNIVVDVQESLKPWRFCKPRFKAKHVLELEEHFSQNMKIKIGNKITIN